MAIFLPDTSFSDHLDPIMVLIIGLYGTSCNRETYLLTHLVPDETGSGASGCRWPTPCRIHLSVGGELLRHPCHDQPITMAHDLAAGLMLVREF